MATALESIQNAVAKHYHIKVQDLKSATRARSVALPRQIAMYIIRKELDNSFPSIGDFFGGRDHTTVMHAVDKVENQISQKDSFKQEVDLILDKLFI